MSGSLVVHWQFTGSSSTASGFHHSEKVIDINLNYIYKLINNSKKYWKYADITSPKIRIRFLKGRALDHDNLSFNVLTVHSSDLPCHIQSEMPDFQLILYDVIQ